MMQKFQKLPQATRLTILGLLLLVFVLLYTLEIGKGFFVGFVGGLLISGVISEIIVLLRRSTS